jgi:hypothetical protein
MSLRDDTLDVCFPTDKKYLHALFCTDEMTLNVLVPHIRRKRGQIIKFTSEFQKGEKVGRLKWTRLLTR